MSKKGRPANSLAWEDSSQNDTVTRRVSQVIGETWLGLTSRLYGVTKQAVEFLDGSIGHVYKITHVNEGGDLVTDPLRRVCPIIAYPHENYHKEKTLN